MEATESSARPVSTEKSRPNNRIPGIFRFKPGRSRDSLLSVPRPPSLLPRNNEFFSLDRNPKKREREGIGNRVNSRQLRRDLVFDVSSLLRETRRRRVRPTLARNINEEAGGREGSGRRRKSVIIPTLGWKSNDVSARKRGGRKETVVFQGSEATGKKRERESLSEFGRSASAGGASKQRCVSKRSIFS